ncbi:hypothetical protein [Paraclostridium bifermentans]|jgi:septal ring factor EnvC (AmiA/AmiB activator)|uniref:Uncharacterized protein n=1 Tax=virus sp. ctE0n6 TaxID=2827985 RepID=A0A8S5RF76_9VIRU|nr:hypothetical protein [Paraclostridium bifermentans]DAE30032.1 MAG TPA: hypothetical protein [virus sp. ctE0n6]
MIEQALTETFKVSIVAGLLLLAIMGLVVYIKMIDKRNLKITDERIGDLKSDIKESKDEIKAMKEENKEDKKTLRLALETFDRTTKEFQSINSNLNDMKTDISIIKEKIK